MSVTWNTPFEASPAGSDSPALGDDKIRQLKEAFRERFEHEHKMDLSTGTASLDGWHIQGSAISYIQADAPTTRPDGSTALSALDNGRLWVDTDDKTLYVYIHGTGWVALVDAVNIALNTTHRITYTGSFIGKINVSLSNYDNDSAPDVKSGSVFDNNGALILITSDATPSGYGGISNSTAFYLYWDESEEEFIYLETVPTWSDALQGWYNGDDRALFSMFKAFGGTLYESKALLLSQNNFEVSNSLTVKNNIVSLGYGYIFTSGSNIINTMDPAESGSISSTYVLMGECFVPGSGIVKIRFGIRNSSGATSTARIYRNGVAVGIERSTTSFGLVYFTENIHVKYGDMIEIYGKATGGSIAQEEFTIQVSDTTPGFIINMLFGNLIGASFGL